MLATSVPVMSAFVNPHLVIDPPDAARKIVTALPDLKYEDIREKLEADKTFFWIKRGLSPREHDRVNRLGIPGLDFQAELAGDLPRGCHFCFCRTLAVVDGDGDLGPLPECQGDGIHPSGEKKRPHGSAHTVW